MSVEKPSAGVARWRTTLGGTEVRVPNKHRWLDMLPVVFLLVVTFFDTPWRPLMRGMLLAPAGGGIPVLFRVLFLTMLVLWLLGLLWRLAGAEALHVRAGQLELRRYVLGLPIYRRRFEAAATTDWRVEALPEPSLFGSQPEPGLLGLRQQLGVVPGTLRFAYAGRTYSFGQGLDPAEAAHILATFRQQRLLPA